MLIGVHLCWLALSGMYTMWAAGMSASTGIEDIARGTRTKSANCGMRTAPCWSLFPEFLYMRIWSELKSLLFLSLVGWYYARYWGWIGRWKWMCWTMWIGIGQFNNARQSQTLPLVEATSAYPYLSSATMIAPSPDWFSGFYQFEYDWSRHRLLVQEDCLRNLSLWCRYWKRRYVLNR